MNDYELILNKTNEFLKSWESKNIDALDKIFKADLICHLSTVVEYSDGSQHSKHGIKNFILDTPVCDYFHLAIYNYVCRYDMAKAQTSFIVVGRAVNKVDKNTKSFEFTAQFVITWDKIESDWFASELRMQMVDFHGNIEEFNNWYFEDQKTKWYPGIHLPVIQGELDSPWFVIPNNERVMSDKEQIEEQIYRFAFGEDTLAFNQVEKTFAENLLAEMAPWGIMDKRLFMTAVKYHRTKTMVWTHPLKIEKLKIKQDKANVVVYRMTGHRQRTHEVEINESNYNHEISCALYKLKMCKINGSWKIQEFHYYLGCRDLGKYEK